ncbi:zinc metalloprotease HtpX [Candidatus Pacebacteria bacterium]|nr:zinc metalloprotease HtpX [Candidatus Paceibacterota bacterium]
MATLYTQQGSNIRKTWFLMAMFLVLVMAIGYGVSWYLNSPIILYIAVAFAVGMNIFSYWHSDKIVLRMTNAKPVSREEHRELWNITENLAITAGLPMPKLYIVEEPAPNAFATGRNPEHGVVAVTTGLLDILDKNELEGVVAHEMAHIGNRDILVMTVAVVLAGFIAILADFFMRSMMFGGDNRDRHPAFLILAIVGIILAPIAAQLIQMAVSRKREYLADASGALLTRYPEGLASALQKISGYTGPMKSASHATAHLFIDDPFDNGHQKQGLMKSIGNLFQTHPPVQNRIAELRQMNI